ncbi:MULTISPECIES: hypervirulence associated TUDOR domain-containing protein [Micromonospora]|uniref:Hypervirulence associated protein TUDOR domain-containing protein n=1 Tax=Micromonospora yangpuensis TaxID=683228 RepID=A0A1C6UZL9_9ACTN|nr:DUF2945 domain-containing protein [Micromonospora yangpuensis]GGL95781.1 hypothetical protein GCM10012279_11500 [Micromonospora yangpuensis]SCL59260.1 Protein of unknown function [Micromonospora yangpuensis]
MAEQRFRKGDHVSWASHSGRGRGVVTEELTERTRVSGRAVDASPQQPQYRIRNDHSGRDVAHRPEALRHES